LLKQLKHANPVAETTTHTEEVVTQSVVNDAETTTHTEEVVTQSMVNDAETTTHTEEVVTQFVVNDAETTTHQKKLLHPLWSTMLKQQHKTVTLTTTAAP
jgi:hypothetical protein